MRKFIVVDESKTGGDIFTKICDTLKDANAEAEYQWDHLTRMERRGRHIFVGHAEDNEDYLCEYAIDEETGEVDWAAYHSLDVEDNYFDSDKI